MDLRGKTLRAALTCTKAGFVENLAIEVRPDGTFGRVGPASGHGPASPIDLPRRALLPGFVNAHSHAFQRGLRFTPQRFGAGSGNFWTWRETMYRLARELDVPAFYEHSRRAFEEMLAAGMTAVGEFHYLHHAGPADDPGTAWAFDDAIHSAARDAGIRLVLIQCYYATGNIGTPLKGAQTRFDAVSRRAFFAQVDRLAGRLDTGTQSLALAGHSVRAVAPDDLRQLHDAARANGWPFHIHVEEARREIDDCRAAYARGPLRFLLETLDIDDRVTAIHLTHSAPDDLAEFFARGGGVCLCPITEGNLSDGFPDLPAIRAAGGRVAFGTDCNLRISATEELRWMEFAQRLRRERRGIVVDAQGDTAPALLHLGTRGGAEALGLRAGAIAEGHLADLVAIDLDHPDLAGCPTEALADALVFGCGNGPVREVWVGGVRRR